MPRLTGFRRRIPTFPTRARMISKKRRAIIPVGPPRKRFRTNPRIGGFLGMEKKFFDVELTNTAFTAAWTPLEPATTNLTAVAQGDGESNRDGRKYTIDSIHIKGYVEVALQESNVTPRGDVLFRLALVIDQQTNGAQLTATDVMDGGQTDDINSFRNLQFTKRFRVLKDKTIRMAITGVNEGAANLFAEGTRQIPFKMNFTFPNGLPVTMKGTTADIANVVDNSIHMIGVSTDTNGLLNYQSRIRFRG